MSAPIYSVRDGVIPAIVPSATNSEALVSAINRLLVRLNARGVSANEIVACIKPLIADIEAELAAERAIVSRIWVQLGSPAYAQLKGRSIYDLIDEMKAELASERARLDWLASPQGRLWQRKNESALVCRASIDAAMKEGK
jgi:hypothetical protein